MSNDLGNVELRVVDVADRASAIKAIRRHTSLPMVEILDVVEMRDVVFRAQLWNNDHDDVEQTLRDLLSIEGFSLEISFDDEVVPQAQLEAMFEEYRDGLESQQHMTNLELGKPDVEALMWLRETSPADVFLTTLRQVATGEGYRCDSKTMDWIRRELSD